MVAPIVYAGAVAGLGALQSAVGRDREEDDQRKALTGADPQVKAIRANAGLSALPDDFVVRRGSGPASTERGALDYIRDTAVDVGAAVPGTVAGVAGFANLPFAPFGKAPFEGVERGATALKDSMLQRGLSAGRLAAEESYEEAAGASDGEGLWAEAGSAAKALATHPSVAIGKVPQVLSDVFLGAKGAGALGKNLSAPVRAAVGEGGMAAGHISAEIGAQTDDETRRVLAIPAGVVTTVIGYGTGSILSRVAASTGTGIVPRTARFLNAADPDVLLAGGVRSADNTAGLGTRVAGGMIREGLLEEAPQSAQETILTNIALGKPWDEGVGRAIGEGATLGAAIGGAFNVPRGAAVPEERTPGSTPDPAIGPPKPEPMVGPPMPAGTVPTDVVVPADPAAPGPAVAAEVIPKPHRIKKDLWESTVRPELEAVNTQSEADALFTATTGIGKATVTQLQDTDWYRGLDTGESTVGDTSTLQRSPHVPKAKWDAFVEGANTVQTKAEADALFKTAAGVGTVTAKGLRESPWYKGLPEETPLTPEEAVAKEEADLDAEYEATMDAFLNDPDAALDALEAEAELGNTVAAEDVQALKSESVASHPVEGKAPTEDKAAENKKTKSRTMSGIYAAISGYLGTEGSGDVVVDKAAGTTRRDNARWRVMSKKSRAALGDKPNGVIDGDGSALVEAIHNTTKRIEELAQDLSATNRNVSRYTRANGDTIRSAQPAEVDEAGLPVSVAEEMAQSDPAAHEEGVDMMANEYEKAVAELGTYFEGLEKLVGRANLRMAMTAGKYYTFNVSRPSVPGQRLNSETSEAVRFSMLYRQYTNGTLGKALTDPSTSRAESRLEARMDGLIDATRAMENIANGGTRPGNERNKAPTSRVMNMLQHYGRTSLDPATARLAKQLAFAVKKRALDGNDRAITITFDPAGTSAKGANGTFKHVHNNPIRLGEIIVYRKGFNPLTVMHEIAHALTIHTIFKEKPSKNTKQLLKLTEFLNGVDLNTVEDAHAKNAIQQIQLLMENADTDLRAQRLAMGEVVAYGWTTGGFQQWMKKTTYNGGSVYADGKKPKTLWASFIITMKRLAGLDAVPNSTFEEFLDVSGRLLAESEEAAGKSIDLRAVTSESKASIDTQSLDPTRAAEAQKAAEARDKGVTDRLNTAAAAADRKTAATAKHKANEKARLAPEVEALDAKRAETAVPKPPRGETRAKQENMLRIDSWGRNAFDSVLGIFTGDKNYEDFATAKLAKTGANISEWSAQGDTVAQVAVGKVLAGLVDKYGAPKEWLSRLGSIKAGIHKASEEAVTAHELLSTASPEARQATLDYIEYGNETALLEAFGENAQEQAAMVKSTVAALENLRVQLTARGMVDDKLVDAPLHEWLNITGRTRFRLNKHQTVGLVNTSDQQLRANNVVRSGVQESDIFTKAGLPIPASYYGKSYLPALRTNGVGSNIEVYVEEGIEDAKMLELGLVLDPQNTRPLRYRKGSNGVIELGRSKTEAERKSGKNAADVMGSLLSTVFELNKKLVYAQVIDEMITSDKDAYISATEPLDIPEGKIIDLDLTALTEKDALARARVPGTWVRMPNNDVARAKWGDLAGQYVAGPVYASLEDFHDESRLIDSEAYHDVVRVWKKYKTVWSPVTHTQNVVGNFILMYMHDIPMSNVKQAFRIIFKDAFPAAAGKMGINLTPQELALSQEFKLSGATLGSAKQADFDADTVLAVNKWTADGKDSASSRDGFTNMMQLQKIMALMTKSYKATDENLMDAYSNQDNVFRLAAYMTHIQQRMEPDGTVSLETKEAAAMHASKSFVDYDISAPWIRNLRQTASPFIAWTYRMIPLMTKLALTKPWKVMAMLGTIHAVNALMYAAMGMDGDDEERERGVLDEYMDSHVWGLPGVPTYIRMPFGDNENPVFLNLGGMVPLAGLFETQNAGVPRVAAMSGPVVIAFQAMGNTNTFFGEAIRDEADSPAQQMQDTAAFIMKGMAPNIAASGAKIADKHFMGGGLNSPLGNEPALWVDMARGVFGLNMREVNLPDQEYKKSFAVKRIKRDFAANRNQRIRNELRRGEPDYYELDQFLLGNQQRMMDALNEEFE